MSFTPRSPGATRPLTWPRHAEEERGSTMNHAMIADRPVALPPPSDEAAATGRDIVRTALLGCGFASARRCMPGLSTPATAHLPGLQRTAGTRTPSPALAGL